MRHLLRPETRIGTVGVVLLGAAAAWATQGAWGQSTAIAQVMQEPNLLAASSPGYLGVLVGDVDSESAAKLKLKEVRGALVTLIDHDAPAGQILKVNDVVLELNGQQVEGAEQLRRMLHEIPPGRNISMLVSRDGNTLTVATQMGDHRKIEKSVWTNMGNGGDVINLPSSGMAILPGGDTLAGTGLRFSIFGSTLKVGALVEPLTSQMAEYLGVQSGLMVKQVARKTEADAAGLRAFDVILKVGTDSISTVADWERALHANQGKGVLVTILRDKKQQVLTLQVDSKHNKGELEQEQLFPAEDCWQMAWLSDPEMAAEDARAAAQELSRHAKELADQAGNAFSQEKVDELRKQAEQMAEQMKNGQWKQQFELNQQQADALRKHAEQMAEQLKNFKIDQKQMDELKRQMNEWQKSFDTDKFKLDQKQLNELKNKMEQWRDRMQQGFESNPQWI